MAKRTQYEKEMQVIKCLQMGLTLAKTAKATSISIATVARIRDRLGARNDTPLKKKGEYQEKNGQIGTNLCRE